MGSAKCGVQPLGGVTRFQWGAGADGLERSVTKLPPPPPQKALRPRPIDSPHVVRSKVLLAGGTHRGPSP